MSPRRKTWSKEMLKLAGVKEGDVVYDLGCGDGRIVVTAVQQFKAKARTRHRHRPGAHRRGEASRQRRQGRGQGRVPRGRHPQDQGPLGSQRRHTLLAPGHQREAQAGAEKDTQARPRVVSHDFDMGEDWKPEKELVVKDKEGREHVLYLWTMPDRSPAPSKEEQKKDEPTIKVPYVPTPQNIVDEMLKLGGVKEGDVVYDLGCGDGRIVITAVKKFKANRGFGVDIDPDRIKESKQAAKDAKVEDKVEFREGDVLKITDVSEATVVCLYLFPEVNERLKPMLQRTLKPGSRIVSHDFLMGDDWKPEKEVTIKDEKGEDHTVYLWTIKKK